MWVSAVLGQMFVLLVIFLCVLKINNLGGVLDESSDVSAYHHDFHPLLMESKKLFNTRISGGSFVAFLNWRSEATRIQTFYRDELISVSFLKSQPPEVQKHKKILSFQDQ